MKKTCSICNKEKNISEFYKEKNGFLGVRTECGVCSRRRSKFYRRTKKGLVTQIYNHQKTSARVRHQTVIDYSLHQLKDWLFSQDIFHLIFDYWVESNYDRWSTPSCDRLDDYKSYTLDNLRITTWDDNCRRSHIDRRLGINNKLSKKVIRINVDTGEEMIYYSIKEAERRNGIPKGCVTACCKGRTKTSLKYKWKYA